MASTASASSSSKKAGGALEFPAIEDEASNLVARVAASALEGKAYQQKKAKTWSGQISETAVRELRALSENFKYIVSAIILQNNGGGLHTTSTCYWDPSTDGTCTVRWENKSMTCIVTVFASAL